MANAAKGVFGNDDNGQPATNNDERYMLSLILGALQTLLGGSTGSGIPTITGSAVGTYVTFHVGNSASFSGGIPVTAKRWAVNFIGTGTGNTFGTNTSITGGQGFSDNASPSALIAIACDGSTVADGFYSTT